MYNHYLYLAYWFVNSVLLFLVGILSGQVILGGDRFNSFESAFYSGFWFTFLIWVAWDFAIARGWKLDRVIPAFGLFFLFNIFATFATSKFSYFTGFALTNYAWVFIIGVLATAFQRIAWILVVNRGRYFGRNSSF